MKSLLKKVLNTSLGIFNIEIRSKKSNVMPSVYNRLKHLKLLGFTPKVIIDGGAFKGFWSQHVSRIFPEAQIILIEPNPAVEKEILENISNVDPQPILIKKALSQEAGTAKFNFWRENHLDSGASLLNHVRGDGTKKIDVELETLDGIASKLKLRPDLVKLDLQGAELLALKGASDMLKYTELFIVEFSCLEAYINRATPRDLMNLMFDNGYRLYDIVDCHYRPYDGAMTGGDFFFIKNTSSLVKYKGWE